MLGFKRSILRASFQLSNVLTPLELSTKKWSFIIFSFSSAWRSYIHLTTEFLEVSSSPTSDVNRIIFVPSLPCCWTLIHTSALCYWLMRSRLGAPRLSQPLAVAASLCPHQAVGLSELEARVHSQVFAGSPAPTEAAPLHPVLGQHMHALRGQSPGFPPPFSSSQWPADPPGGWSPPQRIPGLGTQSGAQTTHSPGQISPPIKVPLSSASSPRAAGPSLKASLASSPILGGSSYSLGCKGSSRQSPARLP